VYTITGLIDVKESNLRTTGNWNEKFELKNAKLNITLEPPTDPILLNAFNKNLESIQKIEENALSFFPRSSHASPNHSCRQNNMGTKKLLHFRHKLFTKVIFPLALDIILLTPYL
jgi:hypothetical protein